MLIFISKDRSSAVSSAIDNMHVGLLKVLLNACPLDVAQHLRDCNSFVLCTTLEILRYLLEVRGFEDEVMHNEIAWSTGFNDVCVSEIGITE